MAVSTQNYCLIAELLKESGHEASACVMMAASPAATHDADLLDLTIDTQLGPHRTTRIMITAGCSNIPRLRELLFKGGEPRDGLPHALAIRDAQNRSALHHAIDGHSLAAVELLLSAGADTLTGQDVNPEASSPLVHAAAQSFRANGIDIFNSLLHAAVERCAASMNGSAVLSDGLRHAFRLACFEPPRGPPGGHLAPDDVVRRARKRQCAVIIAHKLIELHAHVGQCIAHAATSRPALKLLLDAGAKPLAPGIGPGSPQATSALLNAARSRNTACLSLLMGRYRALISEGAADEAGAHYTQAGYERELCACVEAASTHSMPYRFTPPRELAPDPQLSLATVELLFSDIHDLQGAFVDGFQHDPFPDSPLRRAALWNPGIVELLLDRLRGIDTLGFMMSDMGDDEPEEITFLGINQMHGTPLGVAASRGQRDSTQLLLGLLLDDENCPLEEDEVAEVLTGALVDVCAEQYASGIHPSPTATQDATLQALLDAGANPSVADARGYVPLCRAAKAGNVGLIAALMEIMTAGEIATLSEGQQTALMEAAVHGMAGCIAAIAGRLRDVLPASDFQSCLKDAFGAASGSVKQADDMFHNDATSLEAADDCDRAVHALLDAGLEPAVAAETVTEDGDNAIDALAYAMSFEAASGFLPTALHIASAIQMITSQEGYRAYLREAVLVLVQMVDNLEPMQMARANGLGEAAVAFAGAGLGADAAAVTTAAGELAGELISDPANRAAFLLALSQV